MKRVSLLLVLCLAGPLAFSQDRYSIADEDAAGPGSPRVVVLRDKVANVEAAVAPSEGGELSSYRVQFKGQWVEMLYHARDYSPGQSFKGKGPLLWPAVGAQYPVDTIPKTSCGDGTYVVAGKSYPMPCHGFARNFAWKEVARSADNRGARVTVELRDSAETRQDYPFAFQLDATFEVSGGHVTADYAIKSDGSNTAAMMFSIGNHIAFRIPFIAGTDPNKMTFETHNTTQLLRNTVGVLSGEVKARSFATPERLGDFDAHVALPLAGYRSQPFARLADPQGMTLRLTQQASSSLPEPLIRFNAFGGPKAGFFCPEPWFGVQNSLNTGKGVVRLKPGEVWKWRLDLQIEGPAPPDPAPGSGVTRFGGGFAFVEGPVWVKQGYLVFSDIYNSRIMKMSAPEQPGIYRDYTNAANGNSMDVQGRLYSCERDGHRVVRMEKDGTVSVVASEYEGKRLNAPNDVVVRRDGQVYFSDPASDAVLDPRELGFNGVYHVAPDGKISLVAKMPRPNGVALTPDGKTLYVADTQQRKILAYDLDAQGNASRERVFIEGIDGGPDGLRVAANGNLYIACRGIAIYTPDAKMVKMIEFPETPANCAFGDSDLRTLYVTARTSVYRVRIPDAGAVQY
jgi:gluconolactonase